MRSFAAAALPLAGITVSVLAARTADRYLPRLFASFRDYSYQIYLMGIFVQVGVKMLYKHGFISCYGAGYALCIAGGIYVPVIVSLAIKRLGSKYLKFCTGLKP